VTGDEQVEEPARRCQVEFPGLRTAAVVVEVGAWQRGRDLVQGDTSRLKPVKEDADRVEGGDAGMAVAEAGALAQ
jgi:hypothetical protein